MRIAQVVTLIAPDAAYGGPVRVAINQAKALIALGHEVTVFAGTRGYGAAPTSIDGVPVRLYPVSQLVPRIGFAGMTSLGLLNALRSEARKHDVWHIHLARDLITLPATTLIRRSGVPYVIQCHGMIDSTKKLLAIPLDLLLTRPAIMGASGVLTLTPREDQDLREVARFDIETSRVINGVPVPNIILKVSTGQVESLFLARLHVRKRPLSFVRSAVQLAPALPSATFTIVGPDEGEGAAVKKEIENSGVATSIKWEGPLPPEATLDRMSQADIYVLPSVNEPFPMAVLEAMSLGIPVIITATCGLAPYVRKANAGIVIDDDPQSLTPALQALIEDSALRQQMGDNARSLVRKDFSMRSVAQALLVQYEGSSKNRDRSRRSKNK